MSNNIALFGHMGAGKSTIADVLSRSGYQRISFAAPLKGVAALAYGTVDKGKDYEIVHESGLSPFYLSGREILQGIGQAMKTVDRDFWLKCFNRQAEVYGDTPLVVDDGRFLFEFDALKEGGWYTVGVSTNESVRIQRYESMYGRKPTEAEMNHESEREVPDILNECDIIVQGTDDPYWIVRRIMEKMNNGARTL